MRGRFIFFLGFLFFATTLVGQGLKGWSVESSLLYGKIIKHTPKINFPVDHVSLGGELAFKWNTYGRKAWEEHQRYPTLGLNFLYYNIGERSTLGQAVAFFPNISIYLFRKEKLDFNFQVGTGLAYLTQHFDRLENTTNNAIGSNFNNITSLKFIVGYQLSPKWHLKGGFNFTHFSNGAAQLPNFGINIPAAQIGVKYFPSPVAKADYQHYDISKKAVKKWGMSMHLKLAYREHISIGGPKYPIYIASLGAFYHTTKVNRFLAGFEYEFNRSVYNFGLHVTEFTTKAEARLGASRILAFAAHEFLFGRWSIQLQAGTYLGSFSYLTNFIIYNKLHARYYFPAIGKPKTKFYVGICLKSHVADAEYIALGFGAAL